VGCAKKTPLREASRNRASIDVGGGREDMVTP